MDGRETVLAPEDSARAPADADTEIFVLLDNARDPAGESLLFDAPERVIRCDSPADVGAALAAIEDAVNDGLTAAGYFAYELGYLFEPRLAPLLPGERRQPLIWIGLFRRCRRLAAADARAWVDTRARGGWRISAPAPALDRARYAQAVARVLDYIARGDVYQINLTFPCHFTFAGDPLALYAHLRRQQPVAYGGIVAGGDFHVLSLSPELFFEIADGAVQTRPMKGTSRRGVRPDEDAALRAALARDPKCRAENLMIVDLLRNDLGRIAGIGSVRVTDLFTVETYRSLHQMTSGITARLRPGIGLAETLRTLFPCGSVTGAPKIRAMEIIRELETAPRGVYTGALGLIEPGGKARFNVAIRTLMLHTGGRGELGIGSGLVADSVAADEYDECLLKAAFLTRAEPPFSLVETIRWRPGEGYHLLDRHLARLAASAAHFCITCDLARIRALLADAAAGFDGPCWRVRLLMDQDGEPGIEAEPMAWPPALSWRYALSPHPVDRRDPHLYHKTTLRPLYVREFARLHALTGCDEVLFFNDRGELTEGSRSNLFIERGGRLLTPPVACGLLDGTLRRELLETDPARVATAVLRPADLGSADRVFLGNSVRGLIAARPV